MVELVFKPSPLLHKGDKFPRTNQTYTSDCSGTWNSGRLSAIGQVAAEIMKKSLADTIIGVGEKYDRQTHVLPVTYMKCKSCLHLCV